MGYSQLTPEQPPDGDERRSSRGDTDKPGSDDDSKREEAEDLAQLEQERADNEGMIVDVVADVQEPSPTHGGGSDA